MIKNIDEFEKLFKINIPKHDEFEYYVQTLMRSTEYKDLPKQIESFAKFESEIENVTGYKMAMLKKMAQHLTSLQAYNKLITTPPVVITNSNDVQLKTLNKIKENIDATFISLDIAAANFTALKICDSEVSPELPADWFTLCQQLDVHPVLASLKSFRQFVFGNTNPKRLQQVQHYETMRVYRLLCENPLIGEKNIVFLSHDEVIFKKPEAMEDFHFGSTGTQFKQREYRLQSLGKDKFVKTYLKPEPYATLIGVPGNQFYLYFKQYVLNEPVDERDLYFWNDNRLAKWVF